MTELSIKIPFSGFYNSSHDVLFDDYIERECEHLAEEYNATPEQLEKLTNLYMDCNWQAIRNAYSQKYVDAVESLIESESGQAIKLEYESLESPKYYNFETDCIYAKISLEDIKTMFNALDPKEWKQHVKDNCTSYDGFISFYPSDYAEWKEPIEQWGEARLGMVLELYLATILEVDDLHNKLSSWELMEDYLCNGLIEDLVWSNASQAFKDYFNSLTEQSIQLTMKGI